MSFGEEQKGGRIRGWINDRLHPRVEKVEDLKKGMELIFDSSLQQGDKQGFPLEKMAATNFGGSVGWSDSGGEYVIERIDGTTTGIPLNHEPAKLPQMTSSQRETYNSSMANNKGKGPTRMAPHFVIDGGVKMRVVDSVEDRLHGQRVICAIEGVKGVQICPGGELSRGGDALVGVDQVHIVTDQDGKQMTRDDFMKAHPIILEKDDLRLFRKA